MTKEEFEKGYLERSGLSQKFCNEHFVTMECNCGEEICDGWAQIRNNEESIKTQKELYT